MTISQKKEGNSLYIILDGRLDTNSAPKLDAELSGIKDAQLVDIDFSKIVYVSSAGLRVLLKIQKAMSAKKGRFIIHNVNDDVMEVFEMTGFADILTIE